MSETSSHDSFYDSLSDVQEEGRSADFFPGLSAFLSQEEINKSLDLARRAIDNSETEDFDSEKEISQIFSKSPTSLCETPSYEEKKSGEQTSSEGPRDNRRASVQPLAEQAERITSPVASKRKPGVSPLLASPSYIRSLRKAEKRGAKVPNPSAKPKAAQQSKAGPQSQLCDKAASFIEELTSIFREAAKPRNRSPNGESSSPDSGYLSPKNQPSTLMSASASQSPTADQLDQLEMDAEVKQPQGSLCYQAHKAPEETLPHTHIPHPQPQKARHLPSSAPRFIQKLRSQEVAEGSRVYLECRVTGNPAPRVSVASATIILSIETIMQRDDSGRIFGCVQDKPSYFAYKLYRAIHDFGFHNKTVIRILIARSEIDLMTIRKRYKERFGKSLFHDIKNFASGHYKKALLAICAGDVEDY